MKKMAQPIMLSSPEISAHFHQQRLLTRPEVQKLSKLDEMISETLARTDIGEDEKFEIYSGILADFRKLHNQVLKQGILSSPQPDFLPIPQPANPDDTALKTLAMLLQNISQQSDSKIDLSLVKNENEAKKKSPVQKKLETHLGRSQKLGSDLHNKFFLDNSGKFNEALWEKTLDFLTDKNVTVSSVPKDVFEKAEKIYAFMINQKIDTSSWAKSYPLFKHLATQSKGTPKKRVTRSTQQKGNGISKKSSRRRTLAKIDWKKWDQCLSEGKKT